MIEMTNEDRKWCLRRLPKSVFDTMKQAGPALILAGGFIRACISGEQASDIDLFSTSSDTAKAWATTLANAEGKKLLETGNAFTVRGRLPIQVIHRWTFPDPQSVVPSFDFTVARAAIWYDGSKWRSCCDDRFYIDLAAKRLVYCSPQRNEDAGGSLLRVLKFYQRGYRIPLDSFGAVIARLVSGVNDKDRLDESGWAKIITGLLREVDPNVDPEHEAHLSPLAEDEA